MATRKPVNRIHELIFRSGLVDDMQLRSAHAHMEKWGGHLPYVLVELGFVDEEALMKCIADGLNVQLTRLGTITKDAAALARLDPAFCEEHLVFPISLRERVLNVAMLDPFDLSVIDELHTRYLARVQPYLASGSEILAAVSKHYKGIELRTDKSRARAAVELDLSLAKPSSPSGVTSRMAALKGSSANSMLNEILGEDTSELGEAEMARVTLAVQTQEKAGQILKALRALLTEKGLLR